MWEWDGVPSKRYTYKRKNRNEGCEGLRIGEGGFRRREKKDKNNREEKNKKELETNIGREGKWRRTRGKIGEKM